MYKTKDFPYAKPKCEKLCMGMIVKSDSQESLDCLAEELKSRDDVFLLYIRSVSIEPSHKLWLLTTEEVRQLQQGQGVEVFDAN